MKKHFNVFLYVVFLFLIILSINASSKTDGKKTRAALTHLTVLSVDTTCVDSVEVYALGANLTITNVKIRANGTTVSYPVSLTSGQFGKWGSPNFSYNTAMTVILTAKSTGSGFKSIGTDNPARCKNSTTPVYVDSISVVKPCSMLVVEGSTSLNCP